MPEKWEVAERLRKDESHQQALQAVIQGKAILAPEFRNRQIVFAVVGGCLFGTALPGMLALFFGVGIGVTLAAAMLIGFVAGAIAGIYYFDTTHVIDESLERSMFADYCAGKTVRETYFKK